MTEISLDKVKALICNHELKEALSLTEKLSSNEKIKYDLIAIQSRLSSIESANNIGSINFKDYNAEKIAIIYSLIDLLNKIDENKSDDIFHPGISSIKAKYDGHFIKNGFIGLQRLIVEIEKIFEPECHRYSILGHVPSYMRLNPLDPKRARDLFKQWQPGQFVTEYINLVNVRMSYFSNFLNIGGSISEIYFKEDIINYVNKNNNNFDLVKDPIEEVQDRIGALIEFNKKSNYYLYILEEKKTVPKFLLKDKVGLVIDLRNTETHLQNVESIDGVFSKSEYLLSEFRKKFSSIAVNHIDRSKNEEFLNKLLKKTISFKNGKR